MSVTCKKCNQPHIYCDCEQEPLATEPTQDSTDTDTAIRDLTRPILGAWVDGDSVAVPPLVDVVEKLVATLNQTKP